MCISSNNSSLKDITHILESPLFKNWITTTTEILFQVFNAHWIAPFLILKQAVFYWVGCGEKSTHTEFLSVRNQYYATLSGYEQAICTVLSVSSVLYKFLPTLRDNLHSKNDCSLRQYATTFPWAPRTSETLQVLFVFPVLQLTSIFSAGQLYFNLFPLYFKILLAALNKGFSLQSG